MLCGVVFVGVILSVRSLGFVPDWLAVGRVMGKSLEMRKETRYVLALTTWFELEAERCDSVEEIWGNFQFVARKLGLSHLKLGLADQVNTWQANHVPFDVETLQRYCHEYGGKTLMVLELFAPPEVLSPQLFEHFAELAAESWQKAAELWQASAQLPFRFESARSPENFRSRWRRAAMVPAGAKSSKRLELGEEGISSHSENEALLKREVSP